MTNRLLIKILGELTKTLDFYGAPFERPLLLTANEYLGLKNFGRLIDRCGINWTAGGKPHIHIPILPFIVDKKFPINGYIFNIEIVEGVYY